MPESDRAMVEGIKPHDLIPAPWTIDAACADADAIARKNLQVLGNCFRVIHVGLDHRIAGHQTIHLILGNPRILECAPRRIDAELGRA